MENILLDMLKFILHETLDNHNYGRVLFLLISEIRDKNTKKQALTFFPLFNV